MKRPSVYLSNVELVRLNAMVDKTVMNREQFIRTMLAGKTLMEVPPAPLFHTVRMMILLRKKKRSRQNLLRT